MNRPASPPIRRHAPDSVSASSAMLDRARRDLIDAALSSAVDLPCWLQERLASRDARASLCDWLRLLQQRFTHNDDEYFRRLGSLITKLESEPVGAEAAEQLLRLGLGLMFVRFDVAFQRFYVHDILSDLLPVAARDEVNKVMFVPAGEGSIGGVVRTVKKRIADASRDRPVRRAELLPEQAVVSLWSSFTDPRGRVATEDQILGTRSWLASPVFDDARDGGDSGIAGVLIAFFPVEGTLQPQDLHKFNALRGVFWSQTERISQQLLLALENEALSTFLEPMGFAPSARHPRASASETEGSSLERGLAAERLVSATAGNPAARPVGYLAATELDADGSHLVVLDQPFVALLLKSFRLATLDPSRLGLPAADTMHLLFGGARPAWHDGVLIPRWYRQGADDELHDMHCYPPALAELVRPLTTKEIQVGLARHRFKRPHSEVSSPILEQLYRAKRLYRSAELVVDLVVPLAGRDDATWAGAVRINCLRTDDDHSSLAALASTVSDSAALGELSETAAFLLNEIARALASAKQVEDIKRLRDMQFVVAQSLAEGLANCLSPGPDRAEATYPFSRLTVARHSAAVLLSKQSDRALADLPKLLHAFAAELHASVTRLPRIPMVTVWGTGARPLLAADQGSLIDDLLIADPGLYQTVTFLTDVVSRRPGLALSTPSHGRYVLCTEPELRNLVLPPVPSPFGPGFLQLRFSHEDDGVVQLRVLDDNERELATAECTIGNYPEPLGFAVGEGAAVFGSMAAGASPTAAVYAELEQVANRAEAAPLTLEEFRAACPETAACRPFDVLCELAELFESPESGALVRVARIESPLSDSGESPFAAPRVQRARGELPASALLAALSLGEEGSSLASIRQRWLERVQTERLLVAQTEALAAASLSRRFGRLVSHYVHVPLSSLILSYDRELMRPLHQRNSDLSEAARRMYGNLVLIRYVTGTIRQHSSSDQDSAVSQPPATSLGWTDLDELLALLDPSSGGSVLSEFASAGARIECKYPTGKSLRVHGDFGRWAIVVFTLLKNALEAALQARGTRDPSVIVTLAPEHNAAAGDVMLYLRMSISNPCDDVDPRVLAIMQDCFAARRASAPSNPRKPDSMGLGLATAGRILRDLEASRRFELHRESGSIRCILDVPMFSG